MSKQPKSDVLYNDPMGANIIATRNSLRVELTPEELLEQEINDGVADLLNDISNLTNAELEKVAAGAQ